MSLINQVLKDLDKRGAHGSIGEATIRVVHARNSRSTFMLIATSVAATLLLVTASWLVWNSTVQHEAPSIPVVVTAPKAVELPAAPVVIAAVSLPPPRIDSVSPSPISTQEAAQTITINGSNFREGAKVNLREEGGRLYDSRRLLSVEASKIVLKLNFGKQSKAWNLQVLNADGSVSDPFLFTVHATASAAATEKSSQNINSKPFAGETKPVADPKLPPVEHPAAQQAEGISKQPTRLTPKQQAENEFHRAYQLMTQGRNTEAMAGYATALQLDATHALARQNMVSMLLEQNRKADAERVLQEGLDINRQETGFALLLARLQAERNALPQALDTMALSLPYAGKQPEYLAILAALMQRQHRHKEAVEYYKQALQLKPDSGVWLMGLGISLRAEKRNDEAVYAFKQALASHTLNTELKAFVEQQLKEL
jgi:tetratricopeptide (TPR) repeat protein